MRVGPECPGLVESGPTGFGTSPSESRPWVPRGRVRRIRVLHRQAARFSAILWVMQNLKVLHHE